MVCAHGAEQGSQKHLPFCCGVSEVCGGNSGEGKVLAKAPEGGTGWAKPGPALLIPKPGPVE